VKIGVLNVQMCNYISLNPSITFDIVEATLDKPWNHEFLCLNPNITYEYVTNTTNINWSYRMLCHNKMSKHWIFNNQLSYVLK